ncbi:hypothetical protein FACS1894153_0410 [Bacteroidia bacterium]|nr:hypothetical protein FACS1894153_0410 [Bacteroidia bacterium]
MKNLNNYTGILVVVAIVLVALVAKKSGVFSKKATDSSFAKNK